MIRNNYTSISFLIDSVAEQEQVNYLLECIRRVKKGKQKEIRPEDLLIDFNNQEVNEVNVASKPIVSKKSTGSKSSTHKKYEEYGTAGSSGLTHDEKANPVITVDDDEDNELHKSEKRRKRRIRRIRSRKVNENDRPLVQVVQVGQVPKKMMNQASPLVPPVLSEKYHTSTLQIYRKICVMP